MVGGVASALAAAARRGGRVLDGDLGLFEVDEFWLGPGRRGARAARDPALQPVPRPARPLRRAGHDRRPLGRARRPPRRPLAARAQRRRPAGRRPRPRAAGRALLRRRGRRRSRCPSSSTRRDSKHCRRCGHAVRLRRRLPRPPRPLPLPQLRPERARARGRGARRRAARHPQRRVHAAHARRRATASSSRCPGSTTSTTRSAPPRCAARSASRCARRSPPAWAPSRPRSGARRPSTSAAARRRSCWSRTRPGANEVLRTLTLEGARARRLRRPQRPHRRRPRRLLGVGRRLGGARAARAAHDLLGHARGGAGPADEVRRRRPGAAARRRGRSRRASTPRWPTGDGPLYALPTYTALLELRELLARRGQARGVLAMSVPAKVVWHDVECGAYDADLALWRGSPRARTARCSTSAPAPAASRCALAARRPRRHGARPRRRAARRARPARAAAGVGVDDRLADAADFALPRRFALIAVPMQTLQLLPGAEARAGLLRERRGARSPPAGSSPRRSPTRWRPSTSTRRSRARRRRGGRPAVRLPAGGRARAPRRGADRADPPDRRPRRAPHERGRRDRPAHRDADALAAEAAPHGLTPRSRRADPADRRARRLDGGDAPWLAAR